MNAYRVVLIGNAYVGKTALIMKFINKTISGQYEETVGAAFHTFQATIDGESISVQVWDTAGQEKYRSLGPVYYRNASAAILVYDITDRQSFIDINGWIEHFRSTVGDHPPIFLVGNKIDLDSNSKVDENEAQKYADEHGFSFFLTSAITGYNVDFLFQKVADSVVHSGMKVVKSKVNSSETKDDGKTTCC